MSGGELPRTPGPFQGHIERLIADSKASPLQADGAPKNAPNIVLIMLDDVGFG